LSDEEILGRLPGLHLSGKKPLILNYEGCIVDKNVHSVDGFCYLVEEYLNRLTTMPDATRRMVCGRFDISSLLPFLPE
jgi:hypothetical protein